MNLSFSGCGFMGIYHVGVASCIREYAPHLYVDKIAGASAGSMVAACLLCGCDLGEGTSFVLRVAVKARSRALGPLHPSFNLVRILEKGLDEVLPENAHEIVNGRLHVSLTRVSDKQNVVVSQFDTREDLIQALVCSSFVPFYCGLIPPTYKGVRYVDGGLSDNLPILNENTITVSPFAGESDICPHDLSSNPTHLTLANTSIQLTASNLYRFSRILFPPNPEVLSNMCQQGFSDALKFLQENNQISCMRHLSVRSTIVNDNSPENRADSIDSEDSSESGIEDEGEDYMCHSGDYDEECGECEKRRTVLLVETLPPPVMSALQAAIDSVNSGVFARLYKMKAYKIAALVTSPMILPMDIAYTFSIRFLEYLPHIPQDTRWFVSEMVKYVFSIVVQDKSFRKRTGTTSSRFKCTLAIKEVHTKSEEQRLRAYSCSHGKVYLPRNKMPQKSWSIDMGKAVGLLTRFSSPVHYVNHLRHHLLEDTEPHHVEQFDLPHPVRPVSYQVDEAAASSPSPQEPEVPCQTLSDSFENCLHIADEMDSILAFYYTDEKNPNLVKVTEIFSLTEAQTVRQ